ncbi:MAG: hypothetical protein WBP93_18215 [Pyrinomonadaceae bacterium]
MNDAEVEYGDAGEVWEVVRKFESCEFADSEFTHGAHLTVALCYLSSLTVEEATERMRVGLFRFLDHHGVDPKKYNETITLFWIRLVRGFLKRANPQRTLADLANELVLTHGDSKIMFRYYSKELLMSDEARKAWVEPDLKPFDF